MSSRRVAFFSIRCAIDEFVSLIGVHLSNIRSRELCLYGPLFFGEHLGAVVQFAKYDLQTVQIQMYAIPSCTMVGLPSPSAPDEMFRETHGRFIKLQDKYPVLRPEVSA